MLKRSVDDIMIEVRMFRTYLINVHGFLDIPDVTRIAVHHVVFEAFEDEYRILEYDMQQAALKMYRDIYEQMKGEYHGN